MTEKSPPVLGDLHHLEGGRLVFLGTRSNEPGTWYVGFRNSEGDETKFKLSEEAMQALIELVASYPSTDPQPFPFRSRIKFTWREVEVERKKLKDGLKELDPDRE